MTQAPGVDCALGEVGRRGLASFRGRTATGKGRDFEKAPNWPLSRGKPPSSRRGFERRRESEAQVERVRET